MPRPPRDSLPVETRNSAGVWTYFVAPTLLLFAPLAQFLTANQYPILSAESGTLFAACALIGTCLGLTAQLGAKTTAAVLLGAIAALSIDIMYDLHALKLVLVLCTVMAWILQRHISLIATGATFVLVATIVLFPPSNTADPAQGKSTDQSDSKEASSDLPVVLHCRDAYADMIPFLIATYEEKEIKP